MVVFTQFFSNISRFPYINLVLASPAFSLHSWTLKMGPISCPERSVTNYRYSLPNNPKGQSSQLIRGGSMKSRISWL